MWESINELVNESNRMNQRIECIVYLKTESVYLKTKPVYLTIKSVYLKTQYSCRVLRHLFIYLFLFIY